MSKATRRRMKYEPPHGPVACAPKAWGSFFEVLMGGDVARPKFDEEGSYAVVRISGPLMKSGWWGTTYDEIREAAAAAFASECAAVCLDIDSPGGDFAGCFELSRDLRAMAQSSGKPFKAFTGGDCLSAAWAIATACDEIVATESAFVGSVGVWAAHVDITAQDAMFGAKFTIAASGENKADWNPHMALSEEAFTRLQAQVMAQAQLFFDLAAEHRGLNPDSVRSLKGAAVFGIAGIEAGLSDRIVTSWSAFVAEEDSAMPTPNRSNASKYDEALGALRRAAEEDSEDGKKAKKALKAIDDEDKDGMSDEEKEKEKEKAAEEEKEKEEKAKALAATNLALAERVHALEARDVERESAARAERETATRAALFARRPDFGPEVRAALEKLPLADLEKAVEKWPRVQADPGAAAAALTPEVRRDRRVARAAAAPPLTPEQQGILDRIHGRGERATAATVHADGSVELGIFDQATARKRAEQLAADRAARQG